MKDYNIYELLYLYHCGSAYALDLIGDEMQDQLYYWTEEKVGMNRGAYKMYYEDLYQEAVLGLYEAVNTYREDKIASFITFAKTIVDRRLTNFTMRNLKGKERSKELSIDAEMMYERSYIENIPTKDSLSVPEYKLIFHECMEEVGKTVQEFSVAERQVMNEWLDEKTYIQGSYNLNMSTKTYEGKLRKVKKALRNTCLNA